MHQRCFWLRNSTIGAMSVARALAGKEQRGNAQIWFACPQVLSGSTMAWHAAASSHCIRLHVQVETAPLLNLSSTEQYTRLSDALDTHSCSLQAYTDSPLGSYSSLPMWVFQGVTLPAQGVHKPPNSEKSTGWALQGARHMRSGLLIVWPE